MHRTLIKSNYNLAEYFQTEIKAAHTEVEILGSVVVEILHSGAPVTNKAIISRLLQRLETSSDIVSQDIHRYALELVVHRTEDDPLA